MSGYGNGGFDLLQPIVGVHVCDTIQRCVFERIAFGIIILDLQCSGYALLTEGQLIASATTDGKTRL
jgi:hypothetical protein